jgi:hypothetical protein
METSDRRIYRIRFALISLIVLFIGILILHVAGFRYETYNAHYYIGIRWDCRFGTNKVESEHYTVSKTRIGPINITKVAYDW